MSEPKDKPETAHGPLNPDEVTRLSEQVAGLSASGLPLGPGLRATAEEMPRGRLSSALYRLSKLLEQGLSLEEAVAEMGNRLPGHFQGLVLVGTKTGRMSQVLGRFVAFMNSGAEIRRKLSISLVYPMLAFALAGTIFLLVCVLLVGMFRGIFADFGMNLPGITLVMLGIARVFETGWRAFLEGLIGLFLIWLVLRFVLTAPVRRSLVSGLPVLGSVWRNTSLAEFCQLLALLVECEVPLVESLKLTGEGVGDAAIGRACRGLRVDVGGGLSLSQAIARQPIFPKGLSRLLGWAEGHQTLAQSLEMAGEMFGARARSQASFAGTVLGVLAMITMLMGVGAIVLGLMLPLISLISKLSG